MSWIGSLTPFPSPSVFFVGGLYALLNTRSPAPPIIALLGLLGMLAGEAAISWMKNRMTLADATEHCLHKKDFAHAPVKSEATKA